MSAICPSTQIIVYDLPHPHAQDEFYLWYDSENNGNNEETTHKDNDNFDDNDDGSNKDNGLLEGYESDNIVFGSMLSSNDEHSFSIMSHILGGKMFEDDKDLVEFRFGMVFRNRKSFTLAIHFVFNKAFKVKKKGNLKEGKYCVIVMHPGVLSRYILHYRDMVNASK